MNAGLAAAARAYGLDPAVLRPIASAYRCTAAYRGNEILLKPFRHGERQLYYATCALQHLQRQGFLPVPRLVRTLDGEPYMRAGETFWYATTWIAGRPPRMPAELSAAAASLSAFHTAARGLFMPWSPSRSWRTRWQTLLADLLDFRQAARSGETDFDRAYARHAPRFIQLAEQGASALNAAGYGSLEDRARETRAFCHRDCTPANLVVDGAGRVCLVDPDTWGPDLRLADLVRLLHTGAGNDPLRAAAAIAAYERATPLSPGERALMPAALLMPREFWRAGMLRYRAAQPAEAPPPEAVQLLQSAAAGAPARDACVQYLREALRRT